MAIMDAVASLAHNSQACSLLIASQLNYTGRKCLSLSCPVARQFSTIGARSQVDCSPCVGDVSLAGGVSDCSLRTSTPRATNPLCVRRLQRVGQLRSPD